MTDKEHIEEMAKIACPFHYDEKMCFDEHCNDTGCWALPIAEELYNAGYHKAIWHKVADGDLPKDYEHWFLTVNDNGYYEVANFNKNGDFWVYDDYCHKYVLSGIIAWTELPKYKE